MDLRHHQLPWSEQIWAKIHADLTQALAQSRRVRAPFEVFHVPPSQQTVLADRRDLQDGYKFAETETLPVLELWAPFSLRPSQVQNEGDNFFALDRIIGVAHHLGFADDRMLIAPPADGDFGNDVQVSATRTPWTGLDYDAKKPEKNLEPVIQDYWEDPAKKSPAGIRLFDAVIDARKRLRDARRYEPYALILSNKLEGDLSSTVPGSLSLNTPLERMKPLVTAGIHTTPTLADDDAIVVSAARSWVDLAQAMEPCIEYLRTDDNGDYHLRLVERFSFRLKDLHARCKIRMNQKD